MASLKKEQKKLLTRQITSKIMEYLIGLNEKNEPAIQKIAKRSSRRVVSAYHDAIKYEHRKPMKATVKEDQFAQAIYI
jgi:hypothetical protein